MADGRVVEVEAIVALETLPAIPPPPGLLGPRAVESSVAADALLLADARPFRVDLAQAGVTPSDEVPSEHGKRRS
jgi:hypothetical protein